MNKYLVVVIAPARPKWEKKLLKKTSSDGNNDSEWSYVVVSGDGNPKKNNGLTNDCVFVLINQCQSAKQIEDLLGKVKSLEKKVIAWSHQTPEGNDKDKFKPFSCESIKNKLVETLFNCKDFSHPSDTSNTGEYAFLGFMASFANNETWEKRKAILQSSIDETVKKKAKSDAQTLRADILTPFIPLHLYHDPDNNKADDWNKILGECCTAINAEDEKKESIIEGKLNTLIGLKSNLSDEAKSFVNAAFNTLKTNFQIDEDGCVEKEKDMDCRETIRGFAESLEGIVNSIEKEDESQ